MLTKDCSWIYLTKLTAECTLFYLGTYGYILCNLHLSSSILYVLYLTIFLTFQRQFPPTDL